DANGKKVAVDNDTAQKLLMFMPGDEVQVKGNVVKVDSLNDYGVFARWRYACRASWSWPVARRALQFSLFIPIFIAMLAPFPYGVNN
ncbi:hypothetical protein MJM95_27210, partial [Salmonella enterica subsp. enterica serovar Anatum]|nr:hypothetical protein [Salmonella enterica subsp. enterica serovar Anatum]